jgi:GMP synthase (glutamine-hydrolysing)
MRPLLLVQNDPVETYGVALQALETAGAEVIMLDATDPAAPRPALGDLSGVVMFGGTMNVDEVDAFPFLKENRDLTREAVERGVPYLGICLGAQMLARAMDAPVHLADVKEVGFEPLRLLPEGTRDPLVSAWADGDMAFQWHQDTMELPDGAEALATGDRIEVQAYRLGERAWATQFHLEIDAAELELWLEAVSDMDLRAEWGKSHEEVRAEAARFMAAHEARGSELFARFAAIAREYQA